MYVCQERMCKYHVLTKLLVLHHKFSHSKQQQQQHRFLLLPHIFGLTGIESSICMCQERVYHRFTKQQYRQFSHSTAQHSTAAAQQQQQHRFLLLPHIFWLTGIESSICMCQERIYHRFTKQQYRQFSHCTAQQQQQQQQQHRLLLLPHIFG
jgi:hypothetical protein